jgi:carbonic anhydrase
VITDQLATLAEDVETVRSHPLIPDRVRVGGFLYDVDTGRLNRHA